MCNSSCMLKENLVLCVSVIHVYQRTKLWIKTNEYRLYGESMEINGPLVASSLRSDATAQGPRVSKSRISIGRAV